MDFRVELASIDSKYSLWSLLVEYLSELSQYGDVSLPYPYFDTYWDVTERRWPYLIRQGTENVGFALVNTHSPSGRGTDFSIAEFYIVPAARRSGIGRHAARNVFRLHAGLWELSILSLNEPAKRFWPRAIEDAQASEIEQAEADGWTIFRFVIG